MIARYLDELDLALRPLPRRLRARIVDEAADHLQEATAALLEAGEPATSPATRVANRFAAEHAAVSAFGPAELVADRFAAELATERTTRAGWTSAVAAIAFGLVVVAGLRQDALAFFTVQFAFVAGVAMLIRLLRYGGRVEADPGALRMIRRAAALATGCAGVTLAASAAALVHHPAGPAQSAALAGTGLLVAAAAVRLVATRRPLAAAGPGAPAPGVFDDLHALAPAPPLAWVAEQFRRRPWRVAVAVALACGAVPAAAKLHENGFAPRALLAAAVVLAIEALAVLGGFAACARFLGLRGAAGT